MKEFALLARTKTGRPPKTLRVTVALSPADRVAHLAAQRGDRVAFYFAGPMGRQLLGRHTFKQVVACRLWKKDGAARVEVNGMQQLPREIAWLAQDAGHGSPAALFDSIEQLYGLPFNGTLLRW